MRRIITKTVWILSLTSLFTDTASEMLYPVMPLYLESIGFSIFIIGLLEGLAEATAGLSKGYFGKLSDRTGKRMPFVQWGYALSALSKPLMALFVWPVWVFFVRTLDRLGKGVRTGARDAVLSAETTPGNKGKVFGFHRSMDTLGAVLGPLIALLYLDNYPSQYKMLFVLALAPGIVAIFLSLLLKDKTVSVEKPVQKTSFFSFVHYWKQSNSTYKNLVAGLLFFTLFNSSDVFLLLKIKDAGFSDQQVIMAYIFYNLIYAVFSYPLGALADKLNFKKVLIGGIILFAVVYAGMGFATQWWHFMVLFFLYGIYAAGTEGISKAWISNLSNKEDTATAIGTYTAFQSIGTMLASALAGFLWYQFGPLPAFLSAAIAALIVAVYFSFNNKLQG
jgi:MFS family permease